MKLSKLFFFVAIVSVASFVFTGCTDDPCADIVCLNGGDCNEDTGVCDCPAGYDGDDCSERAVLKFLGNWNATDVCPSGNYNYLAEIESNSDSTALLIKNFGGFGTNLGFSTNIDGNTITMPLTDPGNGVLTEGTGTLSTDGNTITWSYTVDDGAASEVCNGTWTK